MGEELGQSPAPGMSKRTRAYIIYAVTAVVIVAGIGFWIWKANQPDITGLAAQVRDSMNHELSTDSNFSQFNLDVKTVTVIHSTGNEYTGLATVTSAGGPEHQVAIDVTFDGEKILWKTEPGAFMWAAQQKFQTAS